MFKRILVCHDGSPAGRTSLQQVAELAAQSAARVHVLLIISHEAANAVITAAAMGQVSLTNDEENHQRSLDESVSRIRSAGIEAEGHIARGDTIDSIAAYSRKLEADLVVVGMYPLSTGGRWWSGPNRRSLAERVSCSILIAQGD